MADATVEISIPQQLVELGVDPSEVQRRAIEWMILSLYTRQKVSSGKAAEFLGISRIDFLDLLRRSRIAYVDWTDAEIQEELDAVADFEPPAVA